jgi:iduronate 2-sulfatase
MKSLTPILAPLLVLTSIAASLPADPAPPKKKYNILFIISDDLTATALSCYGNKLCQTPNIDRIAARGTLFSRAYCQATFCGPSRASFMTGYYPHAIHMDNNINYKNGRMEIGADRATWSQHFKNNGYYAARVGKIYHMGVPGDIETGVDSEDDPASWTEKFNIAGPEWKAPGKGETLEGNPDGKKPVMGGNTFVTVAADGDDLVHADGRAAVKACELIEQHKDKPFFLAVGFVRPHVPFVSPAKYHEPYPLNKIVLPDKIPGDWDDIPKPGINYKTSKNMKMNEEQQKKAVAGYYASVAYMDAQVGTLLDALKKHGLEENTIVIFTSDHGYHLGEHDFWAKVSLHEESAAVPLIIAVPGAKPAISRSLVELIDLYPTLATLCGLEVPTRIQGKSLVPLLTDPVKEVRDAAFSVNGPGFLLRTDKWAYLQYGEDASKGIELFDMVNDPKQYTNLAEKPEHKTTVEWFKSKLADKLKGVRASDLAH